MEEKVIIQSYSSKKTKLFFIGVILVLLAISLIFLSDAIPIAKYNLSKHYFGKSWMDPFCCSSCDDNVRYYEINEQIKHILAKNHYAPFEFWIGYDSAVLPLFILHWIFVFFAGIFCLIYFLLSRCKITITDKNISGRTFWGKIVVLPIHMISAYSISKPFSVVAITTSSGFVKFPCIGNYKEIADVLQQLLNERQQRTELQEDLTTNQNNSKNLDDLVKLKNLLDNNIITQEKYNAKKKEILGL